MIPDRVLRALDATWPPAAWHGAGPFRIAEGQGGGQRVSAARATGPVADADIAAAEAQLAALRQLPLFALRPDETDLDALLARRGYALGDPTDLWHAPVAALTSEPPPPVSGFAAWPPLQIQREIWADGGIGPGRLAAMDRASGPKTALLGRAADSAVGVAFLSVAQGVAVLHALHVLPRGRRQGCARNLVRHAARWAVGHRADTLAALAIRANGPAGALYGGLGMVRAPCYHYRTRPAERAT